MFRSLPQREAQRVAAALDGLKRARQRTGGVSGDDAQHFLEARAGKLRVVYRVDREALKVALLSHPKHARVREFPAT